MKQPINKVTNPDYKIPVPLNKIINDADKKVSSM